MIELVITKFSKNRKVFKIIKKVLSIICFIDNVKSIISIQLWIIVKKNN